MKYLIELLLILLAGGVVFVLTYALGWWAMPILVVLGLLFGAICVRMARRFDGTSR